MKSDEADKIGIIKTNYVVIGETFKVYKIQWNNKKSVLEVYLKKIGN